MASVEPPLPTVAALEALWNEVAARPLWAPPNFWRWFGLARRARLRQLRVEELRVLAPAGKVNDCAACTDICCVGPRSTVSLRLVDVARLMDIGRTDLITHARPIFSPSELAERPGLARTMSSRLWHELPVLRQNSYGACAALTTEGKCGLYPHWPLSCARFPYALDVERRELFYSARCQAFWIHPSTSPRMSAMAVSAVAAYNERIKDLVLLAYAPARLESLGLLRFVRQQNSSAPPA